MPLGSAPRRGGVNFAVFSRHATAVSLVLFEPGAAAPARELALDPRFHRTGDIWHAFIRGLEHGVEYGFRVDGPVTAHHRFDPSRVLLDPYTRAVAGLDRWGGPHPSPPRALVLDDDFDWGIDQPLNIALADTVIYEAHVRGFTADPSSAVSRRGTFEGLIEKIPYLKSLGVTALELLPITEFDETNVPVETNPINGEPLRNFWGYQPIAFFAPKTSYAAARGAGSQVSAFKHLVRELHTAGIEIILDLVFNHTGEGKIDGRTTSFRGLDNATYYLADAETGAYLDYSGCGNTMNCNHPVVRDFILDCLRYWVTEMHVDGFRFDLASVLGRGQDGSVLSNPPLLERIAADPVLANTKLIAEAWDAAGLYQVGTFPASGRWAEWNGRFRDDMRRFLRAEAGLAGAVATRLAGSPDLYRDDGRFAYHSINFITSHDGFTLRDLVSYDVKHNEGNGEQSLDGLNENDSWNCGFEGEGAPPEVAALRARQQRNALVLLMLSKGVPMLLAGDECGRTQGGNNNAYSQDSPVSWVNWSDADEDLRRFTTGLIALRRSLPHLRDGGFYDPHPDGSAAVVWHGRHPNEPDWSQESRLVAFALPPADRGGELYVAINMHWEGVELALPSAAGGRAWRRVLDTSIFGRDGDVKHSGDGVPVSDRYALGPRACLVLRAR